MGAPASQTGLSSPTEPCSTVSALTGFDPSRIETACVALDAHLDSPLSEPWEAHVRRAVTLVLEAYHHGR